MRFWTTDILLLLSVLTLSLMAFRMASLRGVQWSSHECLRKEGVSKQAMKKDGEGRNVHKSMFKRVEADFYIVGRRDEARDEEEMTEEMKRR